MGGTAVTIAGSLPEVLTQALQAAGEMDEAAAGELARRIVRWGAKNGFARSEYYWPIAASADRKARNVAIRAEFNGRNLREICRRYGVSVATVYRAVRQVGD